MKAQTRSALIHRGSKIASIFAAMVIVSANSVYGHGTIDVLKAFELAGFGSSTNTRAPCADLTCSGSDTCDCTTGSASGPVNGLGPIDKTPVSIAYELSVDQTAALNDGARNGECMPATGGGIITLANKSTMNFVTSGLDCDGMFSGTLRLNGGSADHDMLRGLGSIEIGGIDGDTTEILIKASAVDASGGFQ